VPLYEYHCAGCGSRFEVLQRVGQGADGLECPACGASDVEKEYSTFSGSVTGGVMAGSGAACAPRGGFT
jgi:putative FmdB family regulatory protein